MANEITVTNSGSVTKNGVTTTFPGVTSLGITQTGSQVMMGEIAVANVDTTIPLGPVTGTLGVCVFKNLDTSNAISIRVAAAGTKILRVLPGECWPIRLDSGVTAPVAIADAGSPLMQYSLAQA